MEKDRYKAIPPFSLVPGNLPDFQIYMRTEEGKFVLWAVDGNKVSMEKLGRLTEGGRKEIFISLEDEFKYDLHLEANLGKILENEQVPTDNKASIFTRVSTNVVKETFESSLGLGVMSSEALERTKAMVESALAFIAESKSLHALAKMIGHDYQTYEHATKVLWFTVAFLKMYPETLDQIETGHEELDDTLRKDLLKQCGVGALLHDIGKALIAQEIINKNAPLTEVEWEIVKRHPLNSLAMLLDADLPLFVKQGMVYHHENFHGGGYPMGIAGESIPTLARLLRIIDVFEAMTSRRPYKDPMPPLKAAQIMIGTPENGNGEQASNPDNGNGSKAEQAGDDGAEEKAAAEDAKRDDRDRGMRQCFDIDLLRKFIVFLGNVKLDS